LVHLSGRGAADRVLAACKRASLVVVTVKITPGNYGCEVYDPVRLRKTGSLAIAVDTDGWQVLTARAQAGQRLWNSRQVRRALLAQ